MQDKKYVKKVFQPTISTAYKKIEDLCIESLHSGDKRQMEAEQQRFNTAFQALDTQINVFQHAIENLSIAMLITRWARNLAHDAVYGERFMRQMSELIEIGALPLNNPQDRPYTAHALLSHACVSLENPLNPDPGAPNPHFVLSKIKALNSEQFPLQLGLTVVRNQDFAKLYEICDYVYQEIGILPNLAEINYDQFVVPTDQEIEDFQENIYKIFKRWLGESRINVFAYISPEIYSDHGGRKSYLVELDIHDPYGIKQAENYDRIIEEIIQFQERYSYPKSHCPETQCPWYKNCERVKWHWVASYPGNSVTQAMRFNPYCRLKKSFMTAYSMAVIESQGEAV